jgi:asparagine synthase (glutamine-hydrolysing)
MVNATWSAHSFELGDREDALAGVEARNPLMDRRIAELAFAFPHEQRQKGKTEKIALREAMRGLLPEKVRSRSDKADFMHFFVDALRLVGNEFYASPALNLGWLDKGKMESMFRELLECYTPGSDARPVHGWTVWMAYGLGLWWEQGGLSTNQMSG